MLSSSSIPSSSVGSSCFGCLWLPHFEAWAAVRADAALQTHAVAVHRRGYVVAASPQAQQRGVGRGWTVARVAAQTPEVLLLPVDEAAVAWAWEQVLETLYAHTPRLESARAGLVQFEVPSREAGLRALNFLVREWGAHAGLASDRPTAEVAAYTSGAGSIRSIRGGRNQSFLSGVPIEVLVESGVSTATLERLRWFGLRHIGQLRHLSRQQLCEQFEEGTLLWRFAQAGTDAAAQPPISAYTPPPVVEVRLALEAPATQSAQWEPVLEQLLTQALGELNGRYAQSVSIAVETPTGHHVSSRLLREPVASLMRLRIPTYAMLNTLCAQVLVGNPVFDNGPENSLCVVEALTLRLGQMGSFARQEELWETTKPRRMWSDFERTLRSLESRFPRCLWRLRPEQPHSPLPEERFALVPVLDVRPPEAFVTASKAPQRRKVLRLSRPRPKSRSSKTSSSTRRVPTCDVR
jgi:hypothetical protein